MRNARRLRLRFDEAAGVLKLTCPWRTSRKSALAWALDQRDWIDRQLANVEPGEPFVPGAMIPIEGRDVRIAWSARAPRTPQCPYCDSRDTEVRSEFGSTACKSICWCRSCGQPFEEFKGI